jgi:hypothetical protein
MRLPVLAAAWLGVRRSSRTAKGQRRLIVASQTGNPSGAEEGGSYGGDASAVLQGVGGRWRGVLLVTGLPLWGGWLGGAAGLHHWARFLHHGAFLLLVGGFIIQVYMSAVMFPGTLSAMTTGKVTRAWAAFHHPAWFRQRDSQPK